MSRLDSDDFLIPQGTTWAARWPIQTEDGTPLNTAGWTVRSQVRRNHNDSTVLHEWSSELGNASVFSNFVELRVSAQESSAWKWGVLRAVYDVELTLPNGEVQRLAQGIITLSKEVTR